MSTTLSSSDRAVANAAGAAFGRVNAGKLLRKAAWNLARSVVLVLAARECDGWIGVALYALAALALLPYLFISLGQRAIDERLARLELLPAADRRLLTDKTRLYGRKATS